MASDRVRVIRQPERLGKGVAVNAGAAAAHGEVLVFTDANAMFAADALERVAVPLRDKSIGLVTGVSRYPGESIGSVYTGSATIPSSGPNSPQTVNLSGTGLQASLNLSPSLAFANTQVGGTSPTKTATLTNPNSVGLTISSVATSGDFAIVTDGCTGVLPANSSCTVTLTFDPTMQGAETGGLIITSNAKNSPATIALKGTGTLSPLVLTPTSLSFGAVMHGTTSPDKFVTLVNNNPASGGTINISSVTTNNAVFAVDLGSTTCGSTLAGGGASCMIAVNFSPTTTGTVSAALSIVDSAGTGAASTTQKVSLAGTGN